MALLLPFLNRENALFTVETVAERNDPIFTKQALDFFPNLKWGNIRYLLLLYVPIHHEQRTFVRMYF